nr:MAG TPA: YopX protein [Caudoviricetes sp.]
MREILFKAKRKDNGEWIEGYYIRDQYHIGGKDIIFYRKDSDRFTVYTNIIDIETLCQFTGLCDKNGKKIWENDILMRHGNPKDLAKVLFGEFGVRNIETGSIVDKVVGWHYEVVPTDAISRCEPFCWPMPLTEYYIDRCEMEVVGNIFDNPELLQEEHK